RRRARPVGAPRPPASAAATRTTYSRSSRREARPSRATSPPPPSRTTATVERCTTAPLRKLAPAAKLNCQTHSRGAARDRRCRRRPSSALQ
ncbi:hypothetical protein ACJX0J_036390, partial [Zea mays]